MAAPRDRADELVEYYDPTDVFGDLADALAEAYPSIAPELAASAPTPRTAQARGSLPGPSPKVTAPPRKTPNRPTTRRTIPARDDAARRLGARRESGDPARPVAAVVPRPAARERARGPASSSTSGPATTRGSCSGGRSRSTPPISATGIITIHFRTIGRGTEWFTHLRPGDPIDMLGPLGRPFEVDPRSRHLLLIAGGLGMAGVRYLADEAIRDGRQVTLLFGAASARDVYPSSLLPDEVEYVIATDDGSVGRRGLRDGADPGVRGMGRPGVRLRAGRHARGPRPAGDGTPGAAGRREARPEARRRAESIRSGRRRPDGRRSSRCRWSRTWAARSGRAWAASSWACRGRRSGSAARARSSPRTRSTGRPGW